MSLRWIAIFSGKNGWTTTTTTLWKWDSCALFHEVTLLCHDSKKSTATTFADKLLTVTVFYYRVITATTFLISSSLDSSLSRRPRESSSCITISCLAWNILYPLWKIWFCLFSDQGVAGEGDDSAEQRVEERRSVERATLPMRSSSAKGWNVSDLWYFFIVIVSWTLKRCQRSLFIPNVDFIATWCSYF